MIIALALAIAGAFAFGSLAQPKSGLTRTSWNVPRLDGHGVVRLADYSGKPVVVNFFATWCPTCFLELPAFAKVSSQVRGQVQFLGVDSFDDGHGQEMAAGLGIGWWPLGRDIGGHRGSAVHDLFESEAMPLTVFYSADGRVLDTYYGPMSEEILTARLRSLYGIPG